MPKGNQEQQYHDAYPKELSRAEMELLEISRQGRNKPGAFNVSDCTGIGLSGGGIRSATFCLGVFQGLASLRLLCAIDFLSTVSGGGYFGSFYTRYFLRRQVPDFDYVQETLDPCPASDTGKKKDPFQKNVIDWLRENGRYLSPRGSGDLLLAGSVMLRNWIVVQIVLATLFLLLFLSAQLIRVPVDRWFYEIGFLGKPNSAQWVLTLPGDLKLWASPFLALPVLLFFLWAVPTGWAYWMVGRPPPGARFYKNPLTGLIFVALASLAALLSLSTAEDLTHLPAACAALLQHAGWPGLAAAATLLLLLLAACGWMVARGRRSKAALMAFPVLATLALTVLALVLLPGAGREVAIGLLAMTALTACWARASHPKRSPPAGGAPGAAAQNWNTYRDELARNWISVQLKAALVTTLALLAFALIDSLGQTVYLVLLTPEATLKSWAGGLLGSLAALAPFASKIAIYLGGANGGKRPKALTSIVGAAAALLVTATLCTTFCVAANAIAWTLQRPLRAPEAIGRIPLKTLVETKITQDINEPNNWSVEPEKAPAEHQQPVPCDVPVTGAAWVITVILSFLFGQSWPFLNRSTQMPLYSARLTRAYLGASNSRRFKRREPGDAGGPPAAWDPAGECDSAASRNAGGAIIEVIPGDDLDIEHYWPWPSSQEKAATPGKTGYEIYQKGTPLHLINVTVNETLDGKSQVQQQDRKGIGMALGPAGISAGIRHHAVFEAEGRIKTLPTGGFRMFDYPKKEGGGKFTGERLPLGQWLAISGAAFSTGLGARTNLALSLLAGIGNIRLGYWWDSGIKPKERKDRQRPLISQMLGSYFTRIFPVQSYLLDEYTARFHGSARQHWYLSDGGHFENMGGYELIRRRLRTIIIIDSEADPDYTFGGMAALIRKARTDFAAEITFLDDAELNEVLPEGHCFSALGHLRRGKWVEETLPAQDSKTDKRQTIDPVDHGRHSLAHAALAKVSYDCQRTPQSVLIYLKPTLMGNEPLDVLQYHGENPSFPQQTTADQFFDEAQWESYRALGEHIARQVFQAPEGEKSAVWWGDLVDRLLQGA